MKSFEKMWKQANLDYYQTQKNKRLVSIKKSTNTEATKEDNKTQTQSEASSTAV